MNSEKWYSKEDVNRAKRRVDLALIAVVLLALWLSICVVGCTVTPSRVDAREASFDGNLQNSGFLGWTADGFGHITASAHARYNALIETYGRDFTPALTRDFGTLPQPDGTSFITKEALTKFLEMSAWKRAGFKPINP